MNKTQNLKCAVCIMLFVVLSACGQSPSKAATTTLIPPQTPNITFDSGRGSGQYDRMTYSDYESLTTFTPQADLNVQSIYPQIFYCNGSCGYIVCVSTEQNAGPLACQAGMLDANEQEDPSLPERYLDSQVKFKAETAYSIFIKVWATKSVGIYTTGNRTTGTTGDATFNINYARSGDLLSSTPPNDVLDRGGVSFQFVSGK